MTLEALIDDLTRSYWESWKTLKQSEGWTLGPDRGEFLQSPFLVHSFEALGPDGTARFRSDVVLMFHAMSHIDTSVKDAVTHLETAVALLMDGNVKDGTHEALAALMALNKRDLLS